MLVKHTRQDCFCFLKSQLRCDATASILFLFFFLNVAADNKLVKRLQAMTMQCLPGFFEKTKKKKNKQPNWAIHTSAALAWQRGARADTCTGSVYYALHISVDTPGATPCLEPSMERVYASALLPAQAKPSLTLLPPLPPAPQYKHTRVSVCPHSVSTLKHLASSC